MIDPFTLTDEFGPREVIHLCEPTQSLRAIVVVDNVALGPALVRVRIAPDLPVAECARLARVTTLECATVGLPFGGGQAVVFASPQLDAHRQRTLLRCFGSAFARHRDVIAIPDLGTDETAMAWMYDEGAPVAGRPRALGGIGLEELGVTGLGVFHSARVAVDYCDIPLLGRASRFRGLVWWPSMPRGTWSRPAHTSLPSRIWGGRSTRQRG